MSHAVTWLQWVVRNGVFWPWVCAWGLLCCPKAEMCCISGHITSAPAGPQLSDTWKLPSFLYILMKAIQWKTNFFKQRFSKQETLKLCPWELSFTFTIPYYSRILWFCFQLFPALPRTFPKPTPRALFKDTHLILLLPSGGFCCLRTSAIVIILFPSLSYKTQPKLQRIQKGKHRIRRMCFYKSLPMFVHSQ